MIEAATTKPKLFVTIDGEEHLVVLPRRHAERRELATVWSRANLRGAAGLLAFTVPTLDMLRTPSNTAGLDPSTFGYDWYEFGAEALEVLVGRGIDERDMIAQSQPIFLAIAAMLPALKSEVEDARNFSKATGAT